MDEHERHARAADAAWTWRTALIWTSAVVASVWTLAFLGWP